MKALKSCFLLLAYEEPTTKESDRNILEAAKAGEMEILKVRKFNV